MLLSGYKSIEDSIVESLAQKNCLAEELWVAYNKKEKPVTIQAIYKILRKLVEEEIVVKHKEVYVLSAIWKNKIIELLKKSEPVPTLQEGESIQYSFRSLDQLDNYWKHINEGLKNSKEATYFYGAHQFWWMIPEIHNSEIEFYKGLTKKGRKAILLIGGDTRADRETKKIISKYVQVHTEARHSFKMTDSLTVQASLIIRTRLSFKDANKINEVFDKNLPFGETQKQLHDLFKKRIPARILIERNAKKAEALKKQIGKYFY